MRTLAALLLIANLAFFALARGWLQPWVGLPADGQREPQRLATQVNATTVRVVAADAAPAAYVSGICLQAGPFDAARLAEAEAALAAALPTGSWQRVAAGDGEATTRHWLRVEHAGEALRLQIEGLPLGWAPCPPR